VPRARQVARVVGVALADVEEYEVGVAALDARTHLFHAHERDVARGLGDELRDGLAARAVRPERLGQMVRHRDVEPAHERDELRALLLL
jgi:hypothetical protein